MVKEKLKKKMNANAAGVNSHIGWLNQKGITLVALVITIIVMMILVGVTVAVVLNGGLFNTADEATTKIEKEAIYDQIVGVMKLKNNGNISVAETYEAVENNFSEKISGTEWNEDNTEVTFKVTGNKGTYTYKITGETVAIEQEGDVGETPTLTGDYLLESNYTLAVGERTITIPEGFGVVDTTGDTEALIEDISKYETYITEENIENGIVIQDEVGNEFVWIPVDDINYMVMCQSAEEIPEGAPEGTTGRCTLELQGETLKCTKHNSEALAGRLYAATKGISFNANLTGQTYDATSGFREPVVLPSYDTQDGFTQGEAGTYSGDAMYQTEFNLMAKSVAKNGGFYVGRYETGGFDEAKVVSKPDRGMDSELVDINKVTWYKMYQMQKDFGNDIVGSSMIWGCQYDQVMKFVNGKLDGTGETFSVTTYDSNRHSGSGTTGTGNMPADFVANIYDLEGNLTEWTLGANNTDRRAFHGGYYSDTNPASFCNSIRPSGTSLFLGSRLVLYIQ